MKTKRPLPKLPGAYRICGQLGEVLYVGSTRNLFRRYYDHLLDLKTKKHPYRELVSLMEDNPLSLSFTFTIAKDRDHAYDLEQIDLDSMFGNGILLNRSNQARIGRKGVSPSEETRRNISETLTGRKDSVEVRTKKSRSRIGLKHAPEVIERIRASHQGKDRPWLHRSKSPEECAAISARLKGVPKSEDHREKLSKLRSVSIVIDGVTYASGLEASTKLGVSRSEVSRRLHSDKWPTWHLTELKT